MIIPDKQPELWERQVGETNVMFEAFVKYRDLPPHERSMSRVASEIGMEGKVLSSWMSRWEWYDRAQAWDDFQDEKRRTALLRKMIKEAERVASESAGFQTMFAAAVREYERRFKSDNPLEREEAERELRQLTFPQLVALAQMSARSYAQMWEVQREAMGMTTQHLIVQQSAHNDDPFQTDDEFAAAVLSAWREAGIMPDRMPEDTETSPKLLPPAPEETPKATPVVKHRRRTGVPRGRVDPSGGRSL